MSKNLIVFITNLENNFYHFVTFSLLTGKEVSNYTSTIRDLQSFFNDPPEFVKTSVKGIVCNICGFVKNGIIDYEYCQKLAAKLNILQIPYRFMPYLHVAGICTLINAKIEPKIGEEILQIFVYSEHFQILSISRQDNGYIVLKNEIIPKSYDPRILLGDSKPDKIILSHGIPLFPSAKIPLLEHYLSKWKPIVLERHASDFLFDAVKEIVGQMFDEKYNKYFIFPQCIADIGITYVSSNPKKEDILISILEDETLPSTKSCIVPRFYETFYMITTPYKRKNNTIIKTPYEVDTKCHRIELILSVDINNQPTIKHENVLLSKVTKMPKRLNVEKTEKLPVIGFFDNSSVICIWDEENNRYEFLDSWNGKYGKNLFLDFLLEKPALIDSPTEVISLSGAVYDITKIMAMPANNIEIDKKWKFVITKNDENPVLLKFESFEGSKKMAPPEFLMALILKEHLKVIKKEIGKKTKRIALSLLDDFDNAESRKRVEKRMREACELINLQCLFV